MGLIAYRREGHYLVIHMNEAGESKGDIYKTKKMRELLKII